MVPLEFQGQLPIKRGPNIAINGGWRASNVDQVARSVIPDGRQATFWSPSQSHERLKGTGEEIRDVVSAR
jgi:hypothetical protein